MEFLQFVKLDKNLFWHSNKEIIFVLSTQTEVFDNKYKDIIGRVIALKWCIVVQLEKFKMTKI